LASPSLCQADWQTISHQAADDKGATVGESIAAKIMPD
jgi:hypothetical protein